MADEVLRVGLVGAGPWASSVHAPGIAAHPATRLVSVWARRAEAAAELAGVHGAAVAGSPDELFSTVDVVAFAVPPEVQAPLAIKAANAGKDLILEKPIASTVEEAERLADAVTDTGVASIVVLTRRFAKEIADWLDEVRGLGGWRGGEARWLSGALLESSFADSRWRHREGALADIGPHVFDLLEQALGEITEVIGARLVHPDLWHVMFAHDSGATSTASLSLHLPLWPTVTGVTIYGEHGHRELPSSIEPTPKAYARLLDQFTDGIHNGHTEHPCDVRRGLRLQRLLQAVADRVGVPTG